jgi:RNA polymerase sigma factor (sigma-70 family)
LKVDAGEHIGLIYHVINQMHIPNEIKDEAFSEGLVAVSEAAIKFDENRNVALASWLAKNIRWSLSTWRAKQRPTMPINPSQQPCAAGDFSLVELKEVLVLVHKNLTINEQKVLLWLACGFTGIEIANRLNISSVAVTRHKQSGQRKLRKIYEQGN